MPSTAPPRRFPAIPATNYDGVPRPALRYLAWNVGRKDRFEDGFCIFQGAFIPFAPTRAEREAEDQGIRTRP